MYRGVAQLVARCVWDAEVACSSQVAPTISNQWLEMKRQTREESIMEKKKTPPSEAELRRLLALDRAAVEERFAKNKSTGRKIGGVIALVIALVAMITIFTMIAIGSKR